MYILIALLLLSLLVIIHEGGHFLAARACGIEVEEFSVGMGPLLLHRLTKRGTQVSLRLFPIGGFCAFYDETEDGTDPRGFRRQKTWKRAVTVAAGPVMNFVAAFVAIVLYLSLLGIPAAVPRVAAVEPQAAQAGLMIGDTITMVNGQAVENAGEISAAIMACQGEPVEMRIIRSGTEEDLTLTPFYDEEYGRYRVGFTFDQQRMRLSLLPSLSYSWQYNLESGTLILRTLRDLLLRGQGADELTGPVGTVYVISEVTKTGGIDIVFELIAIISVNLGIMNLLPIPALDGSRLLFLLVEGVRGKPVSAKWESRIIAVGFAFLIGLMLLMTYKDIFNIINGFGGLR